MGILQRLIATGKLILEEQVINTPRSSVDKPFSYTTRVLGVHIQVQRAAGNVESNCPCERTIELAGRK
jgi:hypothetical protein